MITGADAITQMRKLDELIKYAQFQVVPNLNNISEDLFDDTDYWLWKLDDIAEKLEAWRDEVTKAGGIKPLESYTELLAPGDKL